MKSHNDPRLLAYEVLGRVEEGAFSDLALDAQLCRCHAMDPRDRGLATELVYGVLRCRGRLDFALGSLCSQRLDRIEPPVLRILRLGAYQLLHLDRIPERAAVHESVEMAHRLKFSRASGFINGVLRSLARQKGSLPWPDPGLNPLECLIHRCSLPPWLAESWLAQMGSDEALAFGEALLAQAPFTLRTNYLKNDRSELADHLASQGIDTVATSFAPEGLSIAGHPENDNFSAGLKEGWFLVQDEASMLVSRLLTPRKGERILDACAAPGGKTTHLAALTVNDARILALDLHEKRLRLVAEGAKRLGCRGIETRPWDLMETPSFLDKGSFDRVLVDAPCSGLGVMRRNPEIRWRRTPADIGEMARTQGIMLEHVAPLVRPGGVLLYSVCTITPEETIGVVQAFLKTHPGFVHDDLRPLFPPAWGALFDAEGNFQTRPHRHQGMDAFFAARLKRRDG